MHEKPFGESIFHVECLIFEETSLTAQLGIFEWQITDLNWVAANRLTSCSPVLKLSIVSWIAMNEPHGKRKWFQFIGGWPTSSYSSSWEKTATWEFAWLQERMSNVPRAQFWDKLNCGSHVKVLSFKPSWSDKKMWELVVNGLPALSRADVTRWVKTPNVNIHLHSTQK